MTADWTPEEKLQIRRSLDSQGRASATAEYVSLRGRKFRGVMQVVKSTVDDQRVLTARITDLSNLKAEQEKSDVSTSASSLDTFDITYKKYFEEGFQAMAFVGINYKFTRANKAFCNLTGYSEQELQQMSFLDILHPDDKEKERKNVSLLFRGEVPISKKEKRFIKRNNEVIWVNASSTLARDERGRPQFVITMVENITQRKRIERSMSDSKEKLNALVENAEYSILSVDKHHTILLINSKLCDILFALTGIVVETGFNLLDILPENFHAEYIDLHKRALQGESFVHDRNVVMHGKRVDIEIVVTPVKDDFTNVMSVSLFGHDITFQHPIIATDDFGNVFFANNIYDSTTFGGIFFHNPLPAADFMAFKADTSGQVLWGVQQPPLLIGPFGRLDIGLSMCVDADASGNFYLGGTQSGTVDWGNGLISVLPNYTDRRIAVAKISPSGSCLLYTSPSPRDRTRSRMPSSA